MMEAEWKTWAIKGAITVEENTPHAIEKATTKLLTEIINKNCLMKKDIISAIFTLTNDLNAEFPAKIARMNFGWDDVPMICTRELPVPHSLSMCIRTLIHINTRLSKSALKHVYLEKAARLRPDL